MPQAESGPLQTTYRPNLESRKAGAKSDFFLIAGEDVNGLAHMGE